MPVDAATFAQECYRIYQRDGSVTPQALVLAGTPERSPIHDLFEWDDAVAAASFREMQAYHALRSLRRVITVQTERGDEERLCRVFVRPPATEEVSRYLASETFAAGGPPSDAERAVVAQATATRHYVPIDVVMAHPVLARSLIQAAIADMEAFRRKYEMLAELGDVLRAMEDTLRVIRAKPAQ